MGSFTMTFKIDDGVLMGYPVGRIDSTNAKMFENDIALMINKYPSAEIAFDCTNLEYISSAGLRILLSLSKKTKAKLRLINVTQGIYDILNITGFSSIFDVSLPLRDISSDQGQFLGMNNGISLYRMDDDTMLKVYPTWQRLDDVKKELTKAKAALLSGVPVLISYDIVTYNGRYGIAYETPNVKTVSSLINFHQWDTEKYAAEMGKTLRMIHSCTPEHGTLPRTSELFTKNALKMDKYFASKEIHQLILLINSIPSAESFNYGNYQPNNVFVMNDELILVDMSGISCGNPIFDLGMTYMFCVLEANWLAKNVMDINVAQAKKLWDIMIRNYFATNDEDVIQSYEKLIRVSAMLCSALLPAMNIINIAKNDAEKLAAKARRDLLSNDEALKNLLKEAKF